MTAHYQRGMLLLSQSRYELALEEFRRHLADDPNDGDTHARMALCLLKLNQFDDAQQHAQLAVHLDPDNSTGYWALSVVLHNRGRFERSMEAIDAALRINQNEPTYFGQRAALWLELKEWQKSLEDAEQGLAIEPDHSYCLNLKAQALVKLRRKLDATESLKTSLAHDAENDITHANLGWALLEQGESQKAMEHFREALRLNPDSQWARHGILEAMKSRNVVYRLFLAYLFAMSKLKGGVIWAIMIGAYLLIQYIGHLQEQFPDWAGWLEIIVVAYIAFALLTWLAFPVSNLILLTSSFGRLALGDDEKRGAILLGSTLAVALTFLIGYLATESLHLKFAAIRMGLLSLPVAGIYMVRAGQSRLIMAGVTLALLVIGLGSLPLSRFMIADNGDLMVNRIYQTSSTLFTFGILGSTLVFNSLVMQRERR